MPHEEVEEGGSMTPILSSKRKDLHPTEGKIKGRREETAQDKQCGSEKMTVHVASRPGESIC